VNRKMLETVLTSPGRETIQLISKV